MLALNFASQADSKYRVLCLGAHCDDIEIGCGGTILKLVESFPNIEFYWVVFSSNPIRAREATTSAELFLSGVVEKKIVIKRFRDGFFPYIGLEIKEYFEQLKRDFAPDLIFTHHRNDLHQDHRLICDLTWNTYRDHLILEYEIPKYDGDLGSPNLFVHLDENHCRRKIDYLFEAFPSQNENHWFTEATFRATLRIRGLESNSPNQFAEAFHCRKLVWTPS